MMHNSVLYDPVKIVCLGKIWFFSYGLKCSQLIRLQYYLIISISGRNQLIPLIFFARNSSSSEVTIWDYYFWLGVASSAHPRAPPPVLMSSSIAGFIDYQYLRKESLDVVVFLDGDSYPGKIASETAFFGWVWPGALLIQSDRRILWLSLSLDGINWYLRFFTFR